MIPVSIEVTNFLSYRKTAVLNFESIHLAGISGPNGAGKSSIMEAMTWALFGQSRARSDDDLVNRQAGDNDAAEVRFTFMLENVIYRILRRKTAGKTAVLELQMDAGSAIWKPLSEGKIRETQAAIEALLQMNYETFTNASFLMQGKADEFTTRTPGQRKEILAELIGVTQWEKYKERAAEARKIVEGRVDIVDARLAEIAIELDEEPQRQEQLSLVKEQRRLIVEKKALKEQLLKQARIKEESRKQQRKILADAAARSERLQQSLEQTRQKLADSEKKRRELDAVIEHEDEISRDFILWQDAEKRVAGLQVLARQHNEIVSAMRPFEMAIAQSRSRLEQEQKALQENAGRAQRSQEERRSVAVRLQDAEEALRVFRKESEQLDQLQKELREAEEALQQTRSQRDLWQQELAALQKEASKVEGLSAEKKATLQNREQAETLIGAASERIAIVDSQRETYSQLKAEQQALQAQQPSLRQEMDKLKERIETLQSADLGGACPICEQPLSEDHLHEVVARLQDDGKHFGDSFRENKARLEALVAEIPELEKTIKQGPQLERDRQAQQQRLAQAEARLAEIARAEEAWSAGGEKRLARLAEQLADGRELTQNRERVNKLEAALRERASVQQKLQDLQGRIAQDKARLVEVDRLIEEWESRGKPRLTEIDDLLQTASFAGSEREELLDLQAKLDVLGYDSEAHQEAVEAREEVASAPERNQALREAKAALEPLQNAVDNLSDRVKEVENDLQAQKRQQEEAQEQLIVLESDDIDLADLEKEVDRLREDEIAAAGKIGAAQQSVDVLDDLRRLREALIEEKAELTQRVRRLKVLEQSCGRQGVQALLIEHALPEIEEAANALLDRLTGGEMRVKFDTQRKLKSRDATAETLDIIISDHAGERPYDNYSGGEQFRINFAIRLALSQLLANRSGVRLQTLVIDEGFGSQDPQGRQRLIEAINAIQDDFACILVITHVDELREAFPTRIEVQKELGGSAITVY